MSKTISDEAIPSNASGKRKRDPTFTASEKLALIELVENHFGVVECKKTDAVTMRQKVDEWRKIESEFNANSSIHPRDWTVLKNCWENSKKKAKQKLTQRNQHFMGTGEGPPTKKNEDPATERVMDLIQPRVLGYINDYDSDSTNIAFSRQRSTSSSCEPVAEPSKTQPMIIINDAGETISHMSQETETATTETVDCAQYTNGMLRDATHPRLISPSPSHVDKKLVEHEQQAPSSTPLPNLTEIEVHPVITPRVQHRAPTSSSSRPTTSRRRPTLTRARAPETLFTHRITTLALAKSQAEEDHKIRIRILRLQEEKEKEIVKQEVLKTKQEEVKLEILLSELRKIKK